MGSWFRITDARTNQPVTGETVFETASLSKPVFTYGVLKPVEQGKLGLDVPLTTYLPKPFVRGDPRLAKITARIVLSHRNGFPNWPADDGSVSIYFTPGERFSYSLTRRWVRSRLPSNGSNRIAMTRRSGRFPEPPYTNLDGGGWRTLCFLKGAGFPSVTSPRACFGTER
jgi:CubicO group peptidase (beta-lactamase class C family)